MWSLDQHAVSLFCWLRHFQPGRIYIYILLKRLWFYHKQQHGLLYNHSAALCIVPSTVNNKKKLKLHPELLQFKEKHIFCFKMLQIVFATFPFFGGIKYFHPETILEKQIMGYTIKFFCFSIRLNLLRLKFYFII